jgi:lambda repressor-like predicted transcriptional regulator
MKISVMNIQAMQVQRGLFTQAELARAAGMSRQALCTILARGSCSAQSVARLATALDVDPREIMKGDDRS